MSVLATGACTSRRLGQHLCFAIYRASNHDYQPSMLHTGTTAGSPEDALDTACGLYLGDPTAWITPPKD